MLSKQWKVAGAPGRGSVSGAEHSMEARRGGVLPQQERAAEPGFLPSGLRLSGSIFPMGSKDHLHQGHLGACSTPRSQYPLDHPNHRVYEGRLYKIKYPGDFGPNFVI